MRERPSKSEYSLWTCRWVNSGVVMALHSPFVGKDSDSTGRQFKYKTANGAEARAKISHQSGASPFLACSHPQEMLQCYLHKRDRTLVAPSSRRPGRGRAPVPPASSRQGRGVAVSFLA